MSDFKKLVVWQKAHAMALDAHRIAGRIRRADHAALRSQIIRAAMSVPANIVEGCNQESAKQFSRFLLIALNSATELEYHLITARDLKLVRGEESLSLLSQTIEVRKMLHGLRRRLATRQEAQAGVQDTVPPSGLATMHL
jgi:four helix bundle protein